MSIRRIGGYSPFVQTPGLIEGQRRVEAVEKPIGTEDTEPRPEEDGLEALNAQHRAELEALEAERARRARETEELRARLMLADAFERTPRELLDLKGGPDAVGEGGPGAGADADAPGIPLTSLIRAQTYAAARAEEARAAEPEVEPVRAEPGAAEDAGWMEEGPGAPDAEAFFASLEDIAHLVPEPEAVGVSPSEPAPAPTHIMAPEGVEAPAPAPVQDEPVTRPPGDEHGQG